MQDLADDIAAALATEFPSTDHPDSPPIILAGHSLGAILAYETLLAWQHTGGGLGVLLVISGQTSPHYAGGGTVHLAADQHIIEEVSRSGPETARALADPELAALYLPAIREDYRLIETYSPHPRVSGWTSSTIVIAKGYGDKELSAVSTTGWRHLSPDVIGPVTVPGDHMHHIRRPELAQLCCGGLLRDAARTPQRKARS